MAHFHRTERGTPWLKITCQELSDYSENSRPICDECLTSLIGCDEVVLIPIFNEAFCPKCGKERLARAHRYPEDIPIEERRAQFYKDYFKIREEEEAIANV